MILVNNPGDWDHIYWPLDHAKWHGWTPTDLIFPFFLFIVGVAMAFSRKASFANAARRAAIIAGLGLFMAAFPFFHLSTLRWPGVLQRIALCYLLAWLLRRFLPTGGLVAVTLAILLGYWWAMTRVALPDGTPHNLAPETNLAAYVDRLVMSGHLWKQTKTWDPEGLLSSLPAAATTVLGALAGGWLRGARGASAKSAGLLGAGLALTILGLAWHESFPINKNLWTSSYVLFTGGLAAYALGALYWVVDARGWRKGMGHWRVYGTNAIFVFVASGLVAKLLAIVKAGSPERSLQASLYGSLFAPWARPENASLSYAVTNVVFWYLVLRWLDRRGLHVHI